MSKQTYFDRSIEGMIKSMDDKTLIDEIHRMEYHLKDLFELYNEHLEYYKDITNEYIERTTEHGKQGKN